MTNEMIFYGGVIVTIISLMVGIVFFVYLGSGMSK